MYLQEFNPTQGDSVSSFDGAMLAPVVQAWSWWGGVTEGGLTGHTGEAFVAGRLKTESGHLVVSGKQTL